jgi:hypothetical protein
MNLNQVKQVAFNNFWKTINYYGGDLTQQEGESVAQFKARKIA